MITEQTRDNSGVFPSPYGEEVLKVAGLVVARARTPLWQKVSVPVRGRGFESTTNTIALSLMLLDCFRPLTGKRF